MTSEAQVCIKIKRLLEKGSWRFFGTLKGKTKFILEAKHKDESPMDGKKQAQRYVAPQKSSRVI